MGYELDMPDDVDFEDADNEDVQDIGDL